MCVCDRVCVCERVCLSRNISEDSGERKFRRSIKLV